VSKLVETYAGIQTSIDVTDVTPSKTHGILKQVNDHKDIHMINDA